MAANIQLEFNNSQSFKTGLVDERWPLDTGGKPVPRVRKAVPLPEPQLPR